MNINNYLQEIRQWSVELRHWISENGKEQRDTLEYIESLDDLLNRKTIGPACVEEIQYLVDEIQRTLNENSLGPETSNRQRNSVPIGKHKLPPLPYPYDALEPYISRRIMKLHHDIHHQSYVDGLNKAENMLEKARRKNDFELVQHWERELAFHGSGHYLHTIFWNNMIPNGGGKPTGELRREIDHSFGSYAQFKAHFSEAAKQVEGVGWAILVWSPRSRRLEILQTELHMILTQWDTIPLLVLDVWEHAYYLQYENKRGDYVDAWWNIVNWKDVEERFDKAKQLKWAPY